MLLVLHRHIYTIVETCPGFGPKAAAECKSTERNLNVRNKCFIFVKHSNRGTVSGQFDFWY